MLTALYYPHTTIKNQSLLKNALLLWDRVECIAPTYGKRHYWFGEGEYLEAAQLNEATELLVRDHVPSLDERQQVHDAVQQLVNRGIPEWLRLDYTEPGWPSRTYPIYPAKLADETWYLLDDHQLSRWDGNQGDYHVSQPLGLLVMSILADICAGKQKRKITDRTSAYAWLSKYATATLGGEYVTGLDASQVSPKYQRLVSFSVRIVNTDVIPLSRLLALRKREAAESGSDLRNFRLSYLQRLDRFVERMGTEVKTEGDRLELERQFQEEMRSDLSNLRKELGLAAKKAILSKEVAVTGLAVAGALAEPISGVTNLALTLKSVGIGALVKTGIEYRAARRKALSDSGMSWLYLASRPRIMRI